MLVGYVFENDVLDKLPHVFNSGTVDREHRFDAPEEFAAQILRHLGRQHGLTLPPHAHDEQIGEDLCRFKRLDVETENAFGLVLTHHFVEVVHDLMVSVFLQLSSYFL